MAEVLLFHHAQGLTRSAVDLTYAQSISRGAAVLTVGVEIEVELQGA
jgi:hypothetical protein